MLTDCLDLCNETNVFYDQDRTNALPKYTEWCTFLIHTPGYYEQTGILHTDVHMRDVSRDWGVLGTSSNYFAL